MNKLVKVLITSEVAFIGTFLLDLFLGANLEGDFVIFYRLIMSLVIMGLFTLLIHFVIEKTDKEAEDEKQI